MRDRGRLFSDADELFCHGKCQRMLPRARFYESNLRECAKCWLAVVKERKRKREWARSQARLEGREPRACYDTIQRIEAGMMRCIAPRPRLEIEVYLRDDVQCWAIVLAGQQRSHLADVHGISVLDADLISMYFAPIVRVPDRLDADSL